MALITETNQQYYQGAQPFRGDAGDSAGQTFTTTFDTDLVFGSYDPAQQDYTLNNFKLYTSATGIPGSWTEYTSAYTVVNNVITITGNPGANVYIVVQLKKLDGGKYGTTDSTKAIGDTVEENYGTYQYIKLNDIINNFLVAYVGKDKLIPSIKRTDVIFHAKRGLQEFSYDTLKSIKSAELTIPESLNLVIPQDYVNYVRLSWIDDFGVQRIIYPNNNLTTNPYYTQLQDNAGVPTQDNFGEDIEGTSITKERWDNADTKFINAAEYYTWENWAYGWFNGEYGAGPWNWGQLYGIDPQYSQVNGWFGINERDGQFTFSSNLVNKLIVLEYLSDGLSHDLDTRVPKLAEEALYSYMLYNILSTRANVQEYIVQRFRKEKSAKIRNAKIRLSNIKSDQIVQVMRGKSKWIKH